ncbi:2-keto-4-pentenoate hydratase (plasmid) [Corynebacterium deserti GIMN1.010]|jgi:2-keto-4-pentenoate hydratase/2-oxohepta-3-ene-1,7-dioic acid hydratase in catechol pathway|uniref:2-keto-4-pentenoate hydratase n=1 Tax=Corynebacterium deserti GIMN1.010 TaxID=931089 RepID=A0A0M4CFX6_9CORY|nr:fumarylacetoacetate hydrolase family protein [Corynebacterium deserti]ALC07166.1 2-keto-4-pentenoate hydratase [Corynebacterium deserti GIMN1.010]
MEFMRLGSAGKEIPVVRHEGNYYHLGDIADDIDGPFLARDGISEVRQALSEGSLNKIDNADQLRIGPPISQPGALVCIGQNYAAHAAESGDLPPEEPIIFFKHPNTIIGPFDDVIIPPGAEKVDWEVELAIVMGSHASYLASHEEALECIAGFTISNDVSERDYQIAHSGGQWSKGKCCPTFNPLGPALVPLEDLADPQALRLSSQVNGEVRQDSTTADMIFSVAEIVRHLSHYMALEPGDIINTGTPEGVALSGRFPYLRNGDSMTMRIEGLGEQRQKLVDYSEAFALNAV